MKNTRLNFKDLHNGRVIYLAEPGFEVVKAVVGTKFRSIVPVIGLHTSDQILSTSKVFEVVGAYKKIYLEGEITPKKLFEGLDKNIKTVVEIDLSFIANFVVLVINGKSHDFQDSLFVPSESRLKVFAKKKQAERYSEFPTSFGSDLESIFSKTNS